jgi:hypothetical protein
MKRIAGYAALCACLLGPASLFAKTPVYGISAISEVHPEGANDATKNLRLAIAITEELGQDEVPLSFFSRIQAGETRAKVTHQVSIYRGSDRIWSKKRTVKFESLDFTSDSWNSFCDAYTKGLEPGDLVIFEFTLNGSTLKKLGSPALHVGLGPREMWSLPFPFWDSNLFECP